MLPQVVVALCCLHLSAAVQPLSHASSTKSSTSTLDKWNSQLETVETLSDFEAKNPPWCDTFPNITWEEKRDKISCIGRIMPDKLKGPERKVNMKADALHKLVVEHGNEMDHPKNYSLKNFKHKGTWGVPSPLCGKDCNTDVVVWIEDDAGKEYRKFKYYEIFGEGSLNDDSEFGLPKSYFDRNQHFYDDSLERPEMMRNLQQRANAYDLLKLMEGASFPVWAATAMQEGRKIYESPEKQKERKKEREISWLQQSGLNTFYMRAYGSALSSVGGSLYDQTNVLEQFEEMKDFQARHNSTRQIKLSEDEADTLLENWLGRQYTGNWNAWMWLNTNLMMRAIANGETGGCVSRGCRPKPKPPKFETLSQLYSGGGVEGFIAMDQEDGTNNGYISPEKLLNKLKNVRGFEIVSQLFMGYMQSISTLQLDFSNDGRVFYPQFVAAMAMVVFASIEAQFASDAPNGILDFEEIKKGIKNFGACFSEEELNFYYQTAITYEWAGETQADRDAKLKRGLGVKDFYIMMTSLYDSSTSRQIIDMDRIRAWKVIETGAVARVMDYGGWHLIIGCMYDYLASYHDLVEAYMSKDAEAVKDAWSTMVGSISNYGMWTNNALGIIKSGGPGAYEDEDSIFVNLLHWIPPDEWTEKHKDKKTSATPKYLNGVEYVEHSDLLPVGCGMYCAADEERRKANAFVSTPWTYLHMLPTLPIYMGNMLLWDHTSPNRDYWPSNVEEQIAYKRLIALRWMTWGLTIMHVSNVREFYLDWTMYTKFPDEGSMDERDGKHIYRLWTSFQLLWYQTWLQGAEGDYMGMKIKHKKSAKLTKHGLHRSTVFLSASKKPKLSAKAFQATPVKTEVKAAATAIPASTQPNQPATVTSAATANPTSTQPTQLAAATATPASTQPTQPAAVTSPVQGLDKYFNSEAPKQQAGAYAPPQQAASPFASDPIRATTIFSNAPQGAQPTSVPIMLEVPDFNVHVTKLMAANGTAAQLSPQLQYEWQFWRMGLRYMASWHTILSCAYDLASNIRAVQIAAKFVAMLHSNYGPDNALMSDAVHDYSSAQANLLVSLTNFGTWVSYHLPTVLIGYPAQVREYAQHHGKSTIPRGKERAVMWTFTWSTVYYIIGTQITWSPNPMFGKTFEKHLGKQTMMGKKLSVDGAMGIVNGTELMPNADGQIIGAFNRPLLTTKMYTKDAEKYGLKCEGGEVFGKTGDLPEILAFDTVYSMHEALSKHSSQIPVKPKFARRMQPALDWLYEGGFDAAKKPVCSHSVPRKVVKAYVQDQISRLKPISNKYLPPWGSAYKGEMENLMADLWMVPRKDDVKNFAHDPSTAPASILKYPSAVLEVGFAAALQPLGSGFVSMNPLSTNMFPSITQPIAMIGGK